MSRILHDWATRHNLLMNPPPFLTTPHKQSTSTTTTIRHLRTTSTPLLPVVFAHGMGDSCFNNGFERLVNRTAALRNNVYAVCIPTGHNLPDDINSGYFLNMDASVQVFADKIRQDPILQQAGGFHAVGLSQGNNVIRGYIAKYNDPPVHTFLSINGVNAGEGAVPHCIPKQNHDNDQQTASTDKNTATTESSLGGFCNLLLEQASSAAYTSYAQHHSFQANYWRDPRPSAWSRYQKYAQLAVWNNEASSTINTTLNDNWAKTERFVWIMANQDTIVFPKEGEHWEAPDPDDPFRTLLSRFNTTWYTNDLFGLRTAEEAGKNVYLAFDGDHLQFGWDQYNDWVTTYLME